jgi:hypothetical protein
MPRLRQRKEQRTVSLTYNGFHHAACIALRFTPSSVRARRGKEDEAVLFKDKSLALNYKLGNADYLKRDLKWSDALIEAYRAIGTPR